MKYKNIKKIMLITVILIASVTLFQSLSFAATIDTQMVKKSDTNYMIYVEETLNEKFEFAFSNNKETKKEDLNFYNSAKDKMENGNSIAYIDEEIFNNYVKDKTELYLWVRQNNEYKLEAKPINLDLALTEEKIQDLNNVTKKIEVTFGEKNLPEEIDKDGVKITRKIGTVELVNKDIKYSYILMKSEKGTDVEKLITLANEVNNVENKNMYQKLSIYNEFKTIYEKLEPAIKDKKWTNVKDGIIEEPIEAKKGDQYLVWIKDNESEMETIDLQIMTCKEENTPKYEQEEVIVKKTVKLPITGDNIFLFVIAGIILALIIVLVVLKVKNNKKENIDNKKENK